MEGNRITIDFTMDLSTDYDLQQLRRALEPVKVNSTWQRRSLDSLTAFYVTNSSSIHKMLVAESDSLFLSMSQIAKIRGLDSAFSEGVRAIYRPLAEYLFTIPGGRTSKAALDSVAVAKKAYWKLFWQQPELADAVRASDGELFLTGPELRGVAEGLVQTIEGELVAFPGSLSRERLTAVDFDLVAFPDNRMSVAILVVDSSFFVLYLKDELLVARVKASFKVVREEAAENYF